MARPTRLDLEGGWYHVLNRGIDRHTIFKSSNCYSQFVELLSQLPKRFGVRIHGYVLMANHYHLQIETPEANLSRAIQWLNVSYSIWFNRKYQRVGPLFQGRFKAVLHEPCTQALVINRYIHLNPVRISRLGGHEKRSGKATNALSSKLGKARVEALRNYPWSSYRTYVESTKKPEWLTTAAVLEFLGEGTPRKLSNQYRRELEEAAGLGEWETDWKDKIKAMLLLGSQDFVERMSQLLKGDRRVQTSLRNIRPGRLSWKQITEAVSTVWDQEWPTLSTAHGSGARSVALYVARHHSDRTLRELAQLAGGMEYPAVTMAIRRLERRLKSDKGLAKKIQRVWKLLQVKT
jgi:REP-associated tyrosine transposase